MTIREYDLYGTKSLSPQALGAAIENTLGIAFSIHESDFLGGDYLLFISGEEEISIHSNKLEDEDGEYLREPAFAEYSTLLMIDGTLRGDEYRARLEPVSALDFLRREIV